VEVPAKFAEGDWRRKARPMKPGQVYPAKEFCSHCGLCDTYYVGKVKEACAFLGQGGYFVERA
jgi:7-hydroxymethyl chlorophyll a reductase